MGIYEISRMVDDGNNVLSPYDEGCLDGAYTMYTHMVSVLETLIAEYEHLEPQKTVLERALRIIHEDMK